MGYCNSILRFLAYSIVVWSVWLSPASADALEVGQDALESRQLSCLLEPSDEIEISSEVTGIVRKVHVERGDTVKKGQRLLSLKSGVESALYDLAKSKHEFAKRKMKRNQDLIDKELLSGHEVDELLTEQRIAYLEKKIADENLRQRSIYSPVNGLVTERHISQGEAVSDDPLLTLVVLDPLHAEVVMSADSYGTIKKGETVRIQTEGYLSGQYEGTVEIVDRVIHAASGTFGVRVKLANKDLSLPAGMKCHAIFE
jgi:RND family efflux transporter MFP subunit